MKKIIKNIIIVFNTVTTMYPNRLELIIKKIVQKLYLTLCQKINLWEVRDETVGFITTIE